MSTAKYAYVVFDRLGAPKGAAVHIAAFARALGEAFGPVDLLTVASDETGAAVPPGVNHHPLPALGLNLIARANDYRRNVARWWNHRKVEVLHFRSIFEGYPLALHKPHVCDKLVFEVNGLPSIELKYHYPGIADDSELLGKLVAQEDVCLRAADLVLTVSPTNAEYLISRGVVAERIRVIPNGVDLSVFDYAPPHLSAANAICLLYSGTMAAWQGVYRAIEALDLLRKDVPATLTLLGPMTPRRRAELQDACRELDVADHVTILNVGDQAMVARVYHEHNVALAPLLRNDRNLVQGCCPLKVLEAMASGTPLVASDIPVVSALSRNEYEALLVKPGSAKAIKDAVLRLLAEPLLAGQLSAAARHRVEAEFTWDIAGRRLVAAYEQVLGVKPARIRRSICASVTGEKEPTICSRAERPSDDRTLVG
ncbi:MAG: glycosyltransferase family 4 protein [Tepidisphaeraceae bacterium]|jgi:glycosyltransferase involved in cell wall biosynthesis